jgi:tRNA pseudouridine13 synthase
MIAADHAGVIEQSILDKENLDSDAFTKLTGLKLSGERRPLRVPVEQIRCHSHKKNDETSLELSFALPAGCFATTVLHEIMKNSMQ